MRQALLDVDYLANASAGPGIVDVFDYGAHSVNHSITQAFVCCFGA